MRRRARMTMRHLGAMGTPYRVIRSKRRSIQHTLLLLALRNYWRSIREYQRDYDAQMPLAPEESRGSGPARRASPGIMR